MDNVDIMEKVGQITHGLYSIVACMIVGLVYNNRKRLLYKQERQEGTCYIHFTLYTGLHQYPRTFMTFKAMGKMMSRTGLTGSGIIVPAAKPLSCHASTTNTTIPVSHK